MKEYLASTEDVLKEVSSNMNGLSSKEAESRLEKNGKNKLDEPKKDGIIKKFIKSLADPMIIMLLAAARNICFYCSSSKWKLYRCFHNSICSNCKYHFGNGSREQSWKCN